MEKDEFQLLKEIEQDIKFLNYQLKNQFDIDTIDDHEELGELFEKHHPYKDFEKDSHLEEILKKTDNFLGEIFDKILKKKKKYKDIYLDLQKLNEENEKNENNLSLEKKEVDLIEEKKKKDEINLEKKEEIIGPNEFFNRLFNFFQLQEKDKIFIIDIKRDSKSENDYREFLEDLKYMLADYFLGFLKINQFVFQFNKTTSVQIKDIKSSTTNDLGLDVYLVSKENIKNPFDVAFLQKDNLFKINKIWFKIGNYDEQEKILNLDNFQIFSVVVL